MNILETFAAARLEVTHISCLGETSFEYEWNWISEKSGIWFTNKLLCHYFYRVVSGALMYHYFYFLFFFSSTQIHVREKCPFPGEQYSFLSCPCTMLLSTQYLLIGEEKSTHGSLPKAWLAWILPSAYYLKGRVWARGQWGAGGNQQKLFHLCVKAAFL